MDSREKLFKDYNNAIITGENGSGKSMLLDEISISYTKNKTDVIGIANTIYDRFTRTSKYFHFFGPQSGRHYIQKKFKKILLESTDGTNLEIQERLRDILLYINHQPKIGISITPHDNLDIHHIDILDRNKKIENNEKERISEILYNHLYSDLNKKNSTSKIEWIKLSGGEWSDYLSYNNIEDIFLFIKHENILIKSGIIKKANIHLEKENHVIEIENISSGEISFLTTMLYISSNIKKGRRTVILIDEPENSLHPSWQKDYLKKILDLFSLFEPRIVIATHSPLLISGAEQTDPSVSIYGLKNNNYNVEEIQHQSNDLEAIIWSFFGITTPESNYISRHFVKKLNMLGRGNISLIEFENEADKFIEASKDNDKQRSTLEKLKEIAKEINERNKK